LKQDPSPNPKEQKDYTLPVEPFELLESNNSKCNTSRVELDKFEFSYSKYMIRDQSFDKKSDNKVRRSKDSSDIKLERKKEIFD